MATSQTSHPVASAPSLRSGTEYLRSLNDGRQVFVDGERVADVTKHPAFREAARSVARLYDIAAAPEMRDRMTFSSPKTGGPVLRAFQIPRDHAYLRSVDKTLPIMSLLSTSSFVTTTSISATRSCRRRSTVANPRTNRATR